MAGIIRYIARQIAKYLSTKQEARMKRIPVFALALALLLAGCAGGGSSTPSPADTAKAHDAAVQAIKETESAWMTDINTKDVEKWLSYYTDDASVLVVNAPIATGKDAIRNMLKPMLSDPAFAIQFSASRVEVAGSNDLGFTQGTYSMTMTDPKTKKPVTEKGKYLTVFRKQPDGSWKSVEDTVLADGPATP